MDLLIKQARLEDDAELVDIAISGGKSPQLHPTLKNQQQQRLRRKAKW